MPLTKSVKFHHSVTELGNLQLRQVVEYVKDEKIISKSFVKHKENVIAPDGTVLDEVREITAWTPADPEDMTGWDDRSKDIVVAITDKKVKADFKVEKSEPTGTGIEEIVTYDRVIEEDGKIAVRRITRIFDDGVEVSKKYHRSWIMPGDDPSNADVISKALATKLHTPKVIAAYKARMRKQEVLNVV